MCAPATARSILATIASPAGTAPTAAASSRTCILLSAIVLGQPSVTVFTPARASASRVETEAKLSMIARSGCSAIISSAVPLLTLNLRATSSGIEVAPGSRE